MVTSKNISKKFALISLYNKKNLNLLCEILKKHKYNFISTGSTYDNIKALGYNCNKVADLTKNKEILKGRVKTLDYKLFSSILYVRDDKEQLDEFTRKDFAKLESDNEHTEAAEKLINMFGTKEEKSAMAAIKMRHNRTGYISGPDYSQRQMMVNKYYSRLK